MRIIIDAEPKEIVALALATQERQEGTADAVHETVKKIVMETLMELYRPQKHALLI